MAEKVYHDGVYHALPYSHHLLPRILVDAMAAQECLRMGTVDDEPRYLCHRTILLVLDPSIRLLTMILWQKLRRHDPNILENLTMFSGLLLIQIDCSSSKSDRNSDV
jgi:hypothetical protein